MDRERAQLIAALITASCGQRVVIVTSEVKWAQVYSQLVPEGIEKVGILSATFSLSGREARYKNGGAVTFITYNQYEKCRGLDFNCIIFDEVDENDKLIDILLYRLRPLIKM